MRCRYHFHVGDRLAVKVVGNLQPTPSKDSIQVDCPVMRGSSSGLCADHDIAGASCQLEADYAGDDMMMSFRASRGPQLYLSYLQSVTPRFVLGGDTTFDMKEKFGFFGLGGKYTGSDWTAVGFVAQSGQVGAALA
jgi:hypothetical protein